MNTVKINLFFLGSKATARQIAAKTGMKVNAVLAELDALIANGEIFQDGSMFKIKKAFEL